MATEAPAARRPDGWVVTGKRARSTRWWYAGEGAGSLTTDASLAKVWQSHDAASKAAQALANVTGRPWHVVQAVAA